MNIHCQVARPDKEMVKKSIVELDKVKEESLSLKVAAGTKCWRKIFLKTIKITGGIFFDLILG